MDVGVNLTAYDFVVLGVLAVFIGRGIWLGFLRQVTGIVALGVGYYAASHYHDKIFFFLKGISDNPRLVFIASCVILFVGTYVVVMLLGKGLARVIEITVTKWFDRFLGALFGAILAILIIVLMHMTLGAMLPAENTLVKGCATCSVLDDASDFARSCITDKETRKALMQRTQAISAKDVMEFLKKTRAEKEREAAVQKKQEQQPKDSSSVQ